MKFARVTGTVVCTTKLDGLEGERLLVIQPLDEDFKPSGQELVATDVTSAGPGELVFFETGREAATALENTWNVSDATIMAIVDDVHRPDAPKPAGGFPDDIMVVETDRV